jgi:hypothetical protein
MPFNPNEPESEQERDDNAKDWLLADVNKDADPAGTPRHIAAVRRVPYQQKFVARCTCGWQQDTFCVTQDGAQRWADTHTRRAA